jgi:hypothetical protein
MLPGSIKIILIAELIADLNSERARASIKSLIGAIPQTALVRRDGCEGRQCCQRLTTLIAECLLLGGKADMLNRAAAQGPLQV